MSERTDAEAGGGSGGSNGGSILDSVDKIAHGAEVVSRGVSGFGSVTEKLSLERQARLDRSLDVLEAFGRSLDGESERASRQVNELAGEFERAGKVFFELFEVVLGDKEEKG